ncbi:MAG: shikimate kinase [Christensenellales bacterium]|jgi:shikimate dehydrogenase
MGKYGLIGERLAHSFSPQIHAQIGDYEYELYEMPEGAVAQFMRTNALDGFNVTVPYKETVMPHLAEISEEARRIGSVNTVVRLPSGALRGYNTDYHGFLYMLGDVSHLRGEKAVILGSGGAAKAVHAVMADAGLVPVIISRTGADNYENLSRHADAAVVVNATPVGMYPEVDASPIDLRAFPRCVRALDLIYNPLKTKFLLDAAARGIDARNGLSMLAAQAVKASEHFGVRPPGDDPTARIVDALSRAARNIALIGMPGAGKTVIGRAIAAITGRAFYDIDEMILGEIGMPIPDYFEKMGEGAFRAVESRMLARAAKETHAVIATGGGIVTVPGNRGMLLQNCAVVAIEREISALAAGGRPVTRKKGVEAIYRERKPLYDSWSERTYENVGIKETARRIAADFG